MQPACYATQAHAFYDQEVLLMVPPTYIYTTDINTLYCKSASLGGLQEAVVAGRRNIKVV